MSSYWYTVGGCIIYKKENEDNIYSAIRTEALNDRWNCYGWVKKVRSYVELKDILHEFELKMNEVDDEIEIYPENTYNSSFLPYMIKVSLPYIENSVLSVRNSDEPNIVQTIEIKDHRRIS